MKIVCSKNELTKGINIVSKAVPSRTTMSILECILIDATTDQIKLTANDMNLAIETVIEGSIEERGAIAIDQRMLSEYVGSFSGDEITFGTAQLNPKINQQAVTCTYSSNNTTIASVSADGLITANGVGSTTVTVKYSETISKTVNVTVTGPEGFYAGISAQSADVAKNPGKWFYHTAGTASNFKCYHLSDKVHLEMNNTGAKDLQNKKADHHNSH